MSGDYKIPFSVSNPGQHLDYAWDGANVIWKDNVEFEKHLTYMTFQRGRSSATLVFVDSQGNLYTMFLQQFNELMGQTDFTGRINGVWIFVKRGQNYGIKLVRRIDGYEATYGNH